MKSAINIRFCKRKPRIRLQRHEKNYLKNLAAEINMHLWIETKQKFKNCLRMVKLYQHKNLKRICAKIALKHPNDRSTFPVADGIKYFINFTCMVNLHLKVWKNFSIHWSDDSPIKKIVLMTQTSIGWDSERPSSLSPSVVWSRNWVQIFHSGNKASAAK